MNGLYLRPRRGESGLTLVELMIALAVIAIALFALISMITHTAIDKESQRELGVAKQAAASKLEEIKAESKSSFTNVVVRYAAPNNLFTVDRLANSQFLPTKKGRGTIVIINANPSLLDITVTIDWEGARGKNSYSIRSLFTQ